MYTKADKISKLAHLFLVACIYKSLSPKYSWGNSISKGKIQNDKIKLPSLPDNSPDFAFMESFIAELEAERVAELEAYLKAAGLDNYELTEEEKGALDNLKNIKWKEFKITGILSIKNTFNILSRDIVANSGKTPYLCASSQNNAVSSYISFNKNFIEKGDCIFIGGKTFTVTYQEKDFYSNDSHNLVLYPIDKKLSKSEYLYLITCIYKSLSPKYSWGNSISKAKIQNDTFVLPSKNGSPDFETMETLISAVQKSVIEDVVKYKDKKIAAAKEVTEKDFG